MAGAADENILQRRLAHRNGVNLSGEGLNHVGDKAVPGLAFHSHAAIVQHGCRKAEARGDLLGQLLRRGAAKFLGEFGGNALQCVGLAGVMASQGAQRVLLDERQRTVDFTH